MTTSIAPFDRLRRFVLSGMRMSHIYQPVMLRELLRRGGSASRREIALALLAEDQSQAEYYEQIVQGMVGKVLKRRGIVEQQRGMYRLVNGEGLTPGELQQLVDLCNEKLAEYLAHRSDPWSHRRKSLGYVTGTLRYEVLRRAKFRCELCGISAEDKALEVDHILPRNKGGTDDQNNLQALCYSCNAMKRDRDDTPFTGTSDLYGAREPACSFCAFPVARIVSENALAIAIRDAYPVTNLHTLVMPKRHVVSYFDLFQPERNAIERLLHCTRSDILAADPSVTGFNIGINDGEDAGQSVLHCHLHLIPRRHGDVARPRGGVRGVIPGRQDY